MPESTLFLRNAGFGDMLSQINTFFHLSDVHSFTPRICVRTDNRRNSTDTRDFLDRIGLSAILVAGSDAARDRAESLSRISSGISDAYSFDMGCYHDPGLKAALGKRTREIHPSLRRLAVRSDLFAEIAGRRGDGSPVTLHVRRGDVAQIAADDFPGIFDMAAASGKVLHCSGVFDRDALEDGIPSGNRMRFAGVGAYLAALDRAREQEGGGGHTLVSDGFTRISRIIVGRYPHLLRDRTLSAGDLEKALEGELLPLTGDADRVIVGENDATFHATICAALASRVIVSASPGFLRQLSGLFELDIRFIQPQPPAPG